MRKKLPAVLLLGSACIACLLFWQSNQSLDTGAPATTTPEASSMLSFETLLSEIEAKEWSIADQHFAGEDAPVFVVFADAHIPQVEMLNHRRVEELDEIYDLEVVYLENIAGTPDSEEDRLMHSVPAKAMKIDSEQVLRFRDDLDTSELPAFESPSKIYNTFFGREDFDAYGFEDADYFAKIAPAAIGEDVYNTFLEVVGRKVFMPLSKGDKTVSDVLILLRAQEYLNAQFEGYPEFDPQKVSINENDISILSEKDNAYIGQLAIQHRIWMLEHACYPRNRVAATRSLSHLQSKGFTRAALLIGADHTRHHNIVEGKTVCEHLQESGVSFILVSELR